MSVESARSVSAIFDKDRLRLARQLSGLRKSDLADKIDVSAQAVGQYEAGISRPSPATLARIALQLGLPINFFAARGEQVADLDTSTTFFRSLRKTRQIERERAVANAALVALVVAAVERRVELPPVALPEGLDLRHDSDPDEAEDVARSVRKAWGLDEAPIPHVVNLMEHHGIIVFRLNNDTQNVDAFSRRFPERPVVALGNDKGIRERSRFDAAHELGHLLMHQDAEAASQPLERQAHRFAAAFLMPREAIVDQLPTDRVDWTALITLKRRWGVSLAALLYRARQLDAMSETTYTSAIRYMARRGWRTAEPGDTGTPEQPALLHRALQLLAANDLLAETAKAVGLPEEHLARLAPAPMQIA